MIKYGTTEFAIERYSLNINYNKDKEVRHYPYTNQSYQVDKGQQATEISLIAVALSAEERDTLEALFNSRGGKNLVLHERTFRNVHTGNVTNPVPFTDAKEFECGSIWLIGVTFHALTPFPYDTETGDIIWP